MPERTLSELEGLVRSARNNPLAALVRDTERLAAIAESLQMRLARTQTELAQVRSDYESLSKKYQRDLVRR